MIEGRQLLKGSLSANSTISHYRILSPLGAGGMGEVWLAQDTKLERKVAIYFSKTQSPNCWLEGVLCTTLKTSTIATIVAVVSG